MTENNKVVYDGQTLIDLTQDDVTASDVRSGVYFHSADGVRGQGTLTSTSIPTADTIAEFDSSAHMNSTDMTTGVGGEVEAFINGLNTQGGLLGDYVAEQGEDNGWTYRKWNSGIIECYISISSPTWGSASTINGITRQTLTNMPTLPTMVSKIDVSASGVNSGCWVVFGFGNDDSVIVQCQRVSGSVVPSRVSIRVIGKWK